MIFSIARVSLAVALTSLASSAHAQQRRSPGSPFESGKVSPPMQRAAVITPGQQNSVVQAAQKSLLVGVPFADAGFPNGFRLSNLGGRREV